MMSKHTPGKWINRGTGCVGTNKQLVAAVYPMEDTAPDEHEANVRLIASAPDLLAFATEWLGSQGSDSNYMTEKARAVIAKATGEQS